MGMRILDKTHSQDGATKFLLEADDGHRFEAVFLVMDHDGKDSLCVSSQVGCALGCSFCATGLLGLMRSLSAAEIVEQVEISLKALDFVQARRFDLSYMGMGEPLRNLKAVFESKCILQERHPRFRFYLSTVGIPSAIRELSKNAPDIGLQISVHAANDDVRKTLIPISRGHPLSGVLDAAEGHAAVCDKPVTLNYCLMGGVNDSMEDGRRLARRIRGRPFRVQVVNFNPDNRLPFRPSDEEAVSAFVGTLSEAGVPVHYGQQLGRLEGAGCGQLDADYRSNEFRRGSPSPRSAALVNAGTADSARWRRRLD